MLDHFSALESALWCIHLICGKKLNTFILAFFPDTKHVTSGCLRLWFIREPTCIVDMLVNSIFDSPSYFNNVASKLRLTLVHSSWELLNLYFMVIYIYIYSKMYMLLGLWQSWLYWLSFMVRRIINKCQNHCYSINCIFSVSMLTLSKWLHKPSVNFYNCTQGTLVKAKSFTYYKLKFHILV